MKSLNAGKVSILVLTAVFAVASFLLGDLLVFAPQIVAHSDDDSPSKVYVCKYVGTPGVNETLQTGQNPIDVSINAIKNFQGVGSYFNDAQGRSYVLAFDTGQNPPSASSCPVPVNFACTNITPSPALASGNKFTLGQTYTFTPTITGGTTPFSYHWSISPTSPALLSTTNSTTSWVAPSVPHPGTSWTLTLNVGDHSENTTSCSTSFSDPTAVIPGCTDPKATNYNADATVDNDSCTYTSNNNPSPTPIPTPLVCTGDTHPDAAGKNCVSFQLGGAPQGGNGGGQVLGASTGPQVLGAKTMAGTGSFTEDLYIAIMTLGGTISAFGIKSLKKARQAV